MLSFPRSWPLLIADAKRDAVADAPLHRTYRTYLTYRIIAKRMLRMHLFLFLLRLLDDLLRRVHGHFLVTRMLARVERASLRQ